jgi:protein O-GlcNAc transferase
MSPQIAYLLNLSIQSIQSNKLNEAEKYLLQVLNNQPKNADALCFLSIVAAYRADFKGALKLINKSIDAFSKNAVAHSNKGIILKELGHYSEALMSFDKAISLESNYAEAYSNKGNVLQELGRYHDAIAVYDNAISLEPNYAEAYSNRGNALEKIGLNDAALLSYDIAISVKPYFLDAWANKGNVLRKLRRLEEASSCFRTALSIDANRAEVWNLIGMLYSDCRLHDEATKSFDKAIDIKSNFAPAWANKASSLFELKSYREASESYQHAVDLDPDLEFALGNLIYAKSFIGCWSNLESNIDQVVRKINLSKKVIQPFKLLSAVDSLECMVSVAKTWVNARYPSKNTSTPSKKSKNKRIRVGYFSPDFRNHPVSFLTAEIFELHNRDTFEIYGFSLKNAPEGDPMRMRLKASFDHFFNLEEMSDLDAVELIRELNIDIAVDMAGHTEFGPTEIFSYRPAPVQINYLGYPGTSGAEYMDYIVADKTLIPEESQKYYTEKIIYMPGSYLVDDSCRQPSSISFSRLELGLPNDKFVFCCFNNSYKFNKKMLQSWANILLAVSESVIWISENNTLFRENLLREFAFLGIEQARIIFAPKVDSMSDHLARIATADLFLDTLPFNAHTTAVDALKAGLPLLTCIGQSFAGRVAASLLNTIGIPELIASSMSEYELKAIDLARNPSMLIGLKQKLLQNRACSELFDSKAYTKNLELAYKEINERYLNGSNLDHLYV